VNELRKQLDAEQQLVYPSERDWEIAWFAFERGEAGDAGIVDHVSFVVVRRLGITDAFTNDRHFKAAGFNTLF
jgi:predicted nucleic acid-binding protein